MNRLPFVLPPLLVAVGGLAYLAYQDALDAEHTASVLVFIVIAVPIQIFAYRISQKQRER